MVPLAGCGQKAPEATSTVATAEAPLAPLDAISATRVSDLVALNNALAAYKAKNGSYPIQLGLTGYPTKDWIPGLAPEFVSELPREPTKTDGATIKGGGPLYMYASPNGQEYKLIVHGAPSSECGPQVERDGIKVDPARVDAKGCWAYGFFSPEMSSY